MIVARRQVRAKVFIPSGDDFPRPPKIRGYFPQVSGGDVTAPINKVYDGNESFPQTLCAPSDVGDVTLVKPFVESRDRLILNRLRGLVGRTFYDITVYVSDCDLNDDKVLRTYNRALLNSLTEPDGDASSGDATMFAMTFSISNVSTVE